MAPVFIVGLPRSGTTLLYQLLLNYFDWSYFTWWTEFFPHRPVSAYRVQRLLFSQPRYFGYTSEYGQIHDQSLFSKPWRPVEGIPIWRRWFPIHASDDHLQQTAIEELRSTIEGFVSVSGKPFLNKYTRNCMRLVLLSEIFPNALFIVVRRQSLYVAQSLYIARIRAGRNSPQGTWWGIRPKEYEELKHLDPLRQAVAQTKAIESELQRQLLCSLRYIEVTYQDVCERPEQILHLTQEACLANGIALRKSGSAAPGPFPIGDEQKVSTTELEEIRRLLEC